MPRSRRPLADWIASSASVRSDVSVKPGVDARANHRDVIVRLQGALQKSLGGAPHVLHFGHVIADLVEHQRENAAGLDVVGDDAGRQDRFGRHHRRVDELEGLDRLALAVFEQLEIRRP